MAWTLAVRTLGREIGRLGNADTWLGKTLANASRKPDTPWPPIAVAAVLEAVDPDGGRQEKALATRYGRDAETFASSHPVTAALMGKVADGYLDHAHREDKQAEHYAWST